MKLQYNKLVVAGVLAASFAMVALLLLVLPQFKLSANEDKEYRPGGDQWAKVWDKFYAGDHEPELKVPLREAGRNMTLVICEAIQNKDMKMRRYAIGALGYIGDKRALPTLEAILKSKDEIFYFRGDALLSIYRMDKALGKKYAKEYGHEHEFLAFLQENMEKDEKWLMEPTSEH